MKRNSIFAIFLLSTFLTCSSFEQKQSLTWKQQLFQKLPVWLQNFLVPQPEQVKFSKSVQNQGLLQSLNLRPFFEQKEIQNDSIINPTSAANKFRQALINAADKNSLMHQFKNNPETFLFGASSSSYQYEGGLDEHNAVAHFYNQKKWQTAGKAINFWDRYEDDIQQMKQELGINCFRLSIAWDRVQPDKSRWDENAINTYIKIIKTLKQNNITPMVVLHHYTIPQWFAMVDGFEQEHNISLFVEFAKKMYTALHEDVVYWSTFNAIEGYAFKGYLTGDGPPGKKSMQLTQTVMAHMLEAHVRIYQDIKKSNGLYEQLKEKNSNIPTPLIGLQKNIVLLDPDERSNICIKTPTGPFCIMGTMVQNKGFFDFFTKGEFKIYIPFMVNVAHSNQKAPESLDWIGLNTYGNMFMRFKNRVPEDRPDFMTENLNYRDYPEGMYRAVKILYDALAHPLTIPIIITENGIATKNDIDGDLKRERFFRRTLYTIRKLIEEGYPIIGYTPWASHDNYEWPSADQPNPYNRPYGFFSVDFTQKHLPRSLKKGAHYYRDFIKHFFNQNYKND